MALLLKDLEAMAEHHNPHRDGVLQLVSEFHAERYGPNVPVDLKRLNSVLAAYRQPLATLAEIDVWYGDNPPAKVLN